MTAFCTACTDFACQSIETQQSLSLTVSEQLFGTGCTTLVDVNHDSVKLATLTLDS